MPIDIVFTATAVLLLLGAAVARIVNPVIFGFTGWLIPLLVIGMYAALLYYDCRESKRAAKSE